ncbi:MAG: hypothetical protein Q4D19_07540 [Lautropia sp.]|nr:hypothetical protein [Lautropia sp.]
MGDGLKKHLKRRLVGAPAELDAQQERAVNEVLADAGTYAFYLLLVLMLVSLVLDVSRDTVSFGTMAMLGVILFVCVYLLKRLGRSRVLDDKPGSLAEYEQSLSRLKRRSVLGAFGWGVSMFVVMNYVFPWLQGKPFITGLVPALIWGAAGVVWGVFVYLASKRSIRKPEA